MKKLWIFFAAVIISSCSEAPKPTYSLNSSLPVKEIRLFNDDTKNKIYIDFYKQNSNKFGSLNEDDVASCLSYNVQNKDESFTLEKMANWCVKSYWQGRDFAEYKQGYNAKASLLNKLQAAIRPHFVKEGGNFYDARFTSDGRKLLLGAGNIQKVNSDLLNDFCQELPSSVLDEIVLSNLTVEAYSYNDLSALTLGKNFNIQPKITTKCLSSAQYAAVKHFESDAEPKVFGAMWTNEKTFKVGVMDEGTKRDGYADYVCLELRNQGVKDKQLLIRVIDYGTLTKSGEWINLGTAHCD